MFLLLSECPAYGLREVQEDYFMWLRPFILSKSGTVYPLDMVAELTVPSKLSELGTLPIGVTGSLLWVLEEVLDLDFLAQCKHNLKEAMSASKPRPPFPHEVDVAGLVFLSTLVLSVCYVQSGLLDIQEGNEYIKLLVVSQLSCSAILIHYLQQILTLYGLFGGFFSLTMVLNPCRTVFWEWLSPLTLNMGRGSEFNGSILCLVHLSLSGMGILHAAQECLFRATQPNLMSLIGTILMVFTFIYVKGIRVDIPVKSREILGLKGSYTIKLLYSSYTPFMLQVTPFYFPGLGSSQVRWGISIKKPFTVLVLLESGDNKHNIPLSRCLETERV